MSDGARYIVVTFTDITRRKEDEKRLRESEERFRQLAESIHEVFWISDPERSRTLYVSPAYAVIWGRSEQTLYDHPLSFLDAIHPEDRERIRQALPRQAEGGYQEEYRVVRPDGAVRWIRDRAFPVRDAEGPRLPRHRHRHRHHRAPLHGRAGAPDQCRARRAHHRAHRRTDHGQRAPARPGGRPRARRGLAAGGARAPGAPDRNGERRGGDDRPAEQHHRVERDGRAHVRLVARGGVRPRAYRTDRAGAPPRGAPPRPGAIQGHRHRRLSEPARRDFRADARRPARSTSSCRCGR